MTRDIARDLAALLGELAALKGAAAHWLTDPEMPPSGIVWRRRTLQRRRR